MSFLVIALAKLVTSGSLPRLRLRELKDYKSEGAMVDEYGA